METHLVSTLKVNHCRTFGLVSPRVSLCHIKHTVHNIHLPKVWKVMLQYIGHGMDYSKIKCMQNSLGQSMIYCRNDTTCLVRMYMHVH